MPGCFSCVCSLYWGEKCNSKHPAKISPGGWHERRQAKKWEQIDEKGCRVSVLGDIKIYLELMLLTLP